MRAGRKREGAGYCNLDVSFNKGSQPWDDRSVSLRPEMAKPDPSIPGSNCLGLGSLQWWSLTQLLAKPGLCQPWSYVHTVAWDSGVGRVPLWIPWCVMGEVPRP